MVQLVNVSDKVRTKFRACIRYNEGGSIFLGYLDAIVCIAGVFTIALPGMKVRLSQKRNLRIEFPNYVLTQDVVDAQGNKALGADGKPMQVPTLREDGQPVRIDRFWVANADSRTQLTNAVANLPEVQTALITAIAGETAARAAA